MNGKSLEKRVKKFYDWINSERKYYNQTWNEWEDGVKFACEMVCDEILDRFKDILEGEDDGDND